MPRDDLSIDFVKRMPLAEPLDPALVLDDWINRVQNLPEEIRFLQNEIADKDRQYSDCVRLVEDRDGRIQKWIKANGTHTDNPREDALRAQIRENYARADQLAADKIALTQKLQLVMDKHLRNLDAQVKMLFDRAEPGFLDPDEVPSLLRPSAANHSAPSQRAVNPAANGFPPTASIPLTPINGNAINSANLALARVANPQVRHTQAQTQHAASAPATPAASMILARTVRENSAGPVPKRVARAGSGLGALPTPTSGLARHSSLGPGTPKGATASGAIGTARAGSAGPRAGSTKGATGLGTRKGTPTSMVRKKAGAAPTATNTKSNLSRVKKASAKNSPASTADSDLSDAESGSGSGSGSDAESDSAPAAPATAATKTSAAAARQKSGTPVVDSKEEDEDEDDADEDMADADDDEAGDDKKYCLCQNVSFGDMVACDNEHCPYEWFHWACVGLKTEPNGTWYCPSCTEKMQKKK